MPRLKGLAYGPILGETWNSAMKGPLGKLGNRDVALSPNQLGSYPIGSYINAASGGSNFGTYRVADPSYIKPGVPTRNTIELRNRNPGGAPVSITRATNPYGYIPGGIDVFGDYPNPPGLAGIAKRPYPQGVVPGGIDITGNSPSSSYGTGVSNPTPGQGQYFQFLNDNGPGAAPPETNIGQNIPLGDENVAPVTPALTPPADTPIGKNIPLGDEFVSPGTQNDFYYSGSPDMNAPPRAGNASVVNAGRGAGYPVLDPNSYPLPGGYGPGLTSSYDPATGTNWLDNATSQGKKVPLDANGFPIPGGGDTNNTAGNWASNAASSTPWGWGTNYVDPRSANSFFGGLVNWNAGAATAGFSGAGEAGLGGLGRGQVTTRGLALASFLRGGGGVMPVKNK